MANTQAASPLMAALEVFEAAEANLVKLERVWSEIEARIPSGIIFGNDPDYEDRTRAFSALQAALPKIDGWSPTAEPCRSTPSRRTASTRWNWANPAPRCRSRNRLKPRGSSCASIHFG